ncbi:hypothetical protein L6164_017419 [Bauhinia variegata]|uniref:Uncharacterized protein n=1 Tax=Bauhinia variegata TaxID=167791 RepID=A0ACB9N7P6_BAUVA|nr:hypothetical protein L6164_017419 [Bauhinia variegata]
MSLVFPLSCTSQLHSTRCKVFSWNSQEKVSCSSFVPFQRRTVPCFITDFRIEPSIVHKHAARSMSSNYEPLGESLDTEDLEEVEDIGSPWEGAVIYKRNAAISHLEYCITLERLGLGELSTEVSKRRASVMGLRFTKAVKDYPSGTPVQISIDAIRKNKRLRLDGIIKSVITLYCNRCCKPTAESIFSEFSLLLTEEPVGEPETIDMGVIFEEEKLKKSGNSDEDDDDAMIDLDDRLHFPPEEKEIDISKNIRDMVHVEITIDAVCDPMCKGLCLKCGTDLNTSSCNCSKEDKKEKGYGPLGNLKQQMQRGQV